MASSLCDVLKRDAVQIQVQAVSASQSFDEHAMDTACMIIHHQFTLFICMPQVRQRLVGKPGEEGKEGGAQQLATSVHNTVMELRKIANHPLLRCAGSLFPGQHLLRTFCGAWQMVGI